MRRILDCLGDHRDRLHGRMHRELLEPSTPHAADPRVIPHIRAIAPMAPELDIVDVGPRTNLEDEDQLVFGAVERTHATIVFVPDNQVLELRKAALPGIKDLAEMTPVHEYEAQGTVCGMRCHV